MSTDAACTPQRESQINVEFNVIEKVQASLSDRISQLEDRIASAMRDPDPTTTKDSAEETNLVPIASRIRSCRYDAERYLSKIEDILDRLEL